jgi:hypothetical protein
MAAMRIADLSEYRHRRETLRETNQRMELQARRDETLALLDDVAPHLRRLYLVAQEVGPSAMHSVAVIDHRLRRLRAQWDDSGNDAA